MARKTIAECEREIYRLTEQVETLQTEIRDLEATQTDHNECTPTWQHTELLAEYARLQGQYNELNRCVEIISGLVSKPDSQ